MTRTHRVGTLTLGSCLIIFGVLFSLKLFITSISYEFLLSLWPVILIFLGGEVIVAYIINKEEKLRYDSVAFFLIIILTIFAMGMGGFEFLLEHAVESMRFIR